MSTKHESHHDRRAPYEFDPATKMEALKNKCLCDECGLPATKDDPFECDHEIAIWWARENPVFAIEVIRSIANLQILHRSCHKKKHEKESRLYYQEKAKVVLERYLDKVVDHRKDDWRDELKKYGRVNYETTD